MRVIYLHRTQGRGVEAVHIRGIVDALRGQGHEVRIVGPSDPYSPLPTCEEGAGLGARFARHAPELMFELAEMAYDRGLYRKLVTVAEEFEPELIYERYAFFGGAGSCLAARLGIPHIVEVNYTCDDPLVRRRSSLLKPAARRLESAIFGQARVIAPVSSALAGRVRLRGADPDRIVITPNAVSRDWWQRAAAIAPAELPAHLSGKRVVGFVGGFYPWHGLDRLVDAAAHCRVRNLDCALLLVGDGPERESIVKRLEAAGLADSALLLGALPHGELAPWIAAMDVCVMPHSNDYGSPMKVFEYMAMGRAVLAPDLPPLRDVIDSGANGLLFRSAGENGVSGLAVGLEELLAGEAGRLEAMGAAAREDVGRKHTWDENLRRMLAAAERAASPAEARMRSSELIGELG